MHWHNKLLSKNVSAVQQLRNIYTEYLILESSIHKRCDYITSAHRDFFLLLRLINTLTYLLTWIYTKYYCLLKYEYGVINNEHQKRWDLIFMGHPVACYKLFPKRCRVYFCTIFILNKYIYRRITFTFQIYTSCIMPVTNSVSVSSVLTLVFV